MLYRQFRYRSCGKTRLFNTGSSRCDRCVRVRERVLELSGLESTRYLGRA